MPSLKQRVADTVGRLRERYPLLDHTVRMVQHYGSVNGNGQAGAVTYFGFLSIFPILAIAFFVVGKLAVLYPAIQVDMVDELKDLLPGVIDHGTGGGGIALSDIEDAAGKVGIIGLLALLYAGLGWLSAMRQALEVMFVVPRRQHPNLVLGKLLELGTLVVVGLILLVSVALTGAVTGFSQTILGWFGVDPGSTVPAILLSVIGHALAIAASTALLMAMFRLMLVETHTPRRALLAGAFLGAVGFELLKLVANLLLAHTRGQPAFQAFGVALILLIWINYFSRLVMYAAAWAYTAPAALAQRTAEAMRAPGAALTGDNGASGDTMNDMRVAVSNEAVALPPAGLARRRTPWVVGVVGATVGFLISRTLRR
jgi:membrane protein